MPEPVLLLDAAAVQERLERIAREIAARHGSGAEVALVGIQRGGVHLAKRLSRLLGELWGHTVPDGSLDINMHRDDLDRQMTPDVHVTIIPFDVTDKTVVLVDDVLFSGRTTRAAMDALHDLGRPKRVELAVLIDRGHRELPIQPDYVGQTLATQPTERVEVRLQEEDGVDRVSLRQS